MNRSRARESGASADETIRIAKVTSADQEVNKSSLTSFHLSSHSRKSPPSLAIPPENPAHGNSMHMRDNAYILGRAGVRKLRCSFDRCTNQVQQGGLCISHDASIIRCSHEPVQKGRCRRHGAKLLKNAVGRLL